MGRGLLLSFFLCLEAASQTNSQRSSSDEASVKAIVDHWRQAWERFDGSVLQGDYAEDADWLNAFGVRKNGGSEIVAYVSEVVKRPLVQGRQTTWGEIHVRFVRPDIAFAYRDYQTVGHKTPDGHEMAPRHTHANWVLAKEAGVWRIVSHVISDEQR